MELGLTGVYRLLFVEQLEFYAIVELTSLMKFAPNSVRMSEDANIYI